MKVIQHFHQNCNSKALKVRSLQMAKDLGWDQNTFLNSILIQERRAKLVILPICKSKEHLRSNINAKQVLLIHRHFLQKTARKKDSDQMQFGTRIRINGRCPKVQIFTTNSSTAKTTIQESIVENSNKLATHWMESNRFCLKKSLLLLKFQFSLSILRTRETSSLRKGSTLCKNNL